MRRASALVLLLVLPLLVTSAPPAAAQEASPSPRPDPVQVTRADDGRTVHLVPGQELVVELTPPSQGEQWQGPDTVDALYLVAYAEGAERTTATLEALRPSAEPVVLRARTDRACFHDGSPCPQAFSTWSLSVVVDEGPTTAPSYQCWGMPTPSMTPGNAFITAADDGKRFTIEQGKLAYVQLGGCEDPYVVPTATGPLFPDGHSYRAHGANSSWFRGLALGTSTITSFTDPACFHTATPCARPSRSWSVEVEVVPAAVDDSCLVPMAAELDRSTVTATGSARVFVDTVPGTAVELYAYTRPSTTYRLVRTGTAGEDGVVSFTVRPPSNTRLYAQKVGCEPGPSIVLNVATALTLTVERTGVREYLFAGDSMPARSGGLIVSLYRVTPEGRQVLTAQARAGALDGEWRVQRRFTGSGRFGFVARTGQDLQNAPGSSNLRSLLVY